MSIAIRRLERVYGRLDGISSTVGGADRCVDFFEARWCCPASFVRSPTPITIHPQYHLHATAAIGRAALPDQLSADGHLATKALARRAGTRPGHYCPSSSAVARHNTKNQHLANADYRFLPESGIETHGRSSPHQLGRSPAPTAGHQPGWFDTGRAITAPPVVVKATAPADLGISGSQLAVQPITSREIAANALSFIKGR